MKHCLDCGMELERSKKYCAQCAKDRQLAYNKEYKANRRKKVANV